jgi:hypothetical protein
MEVSGQFHAPAVLPSVEGAPGVKSVADWMGPEVEVKAAETRNILHCQESNPSPSLYRLSYAVFCRS